MPKSPKWVDPTVRAIIGTPDYRLVFPITIGGYVLVAFSGHINGFWDFAGYIGVVIIGLIISKSLKNNRFAISESNPDSVTKITTAEKATRDVDVGDTPSTFGTS